MPPKAGQVRKNVARPTRGGHTGRGGRASTGGRPSVGGAKRGRKSIGMSRTLAHNAKSKHLLTL